MLTMTTDDRGSALAAAVALVGDRWTLLLIDALQAGARRFNELLDEVPGIAPNVLSQRLKHLEREALIVARPYSQRPLRVEYDLTGPGRDLGGALRLLAHWGARGSHGAEAPRHQACGTPLEARWYCPTCASSVDDDQAGELHFL